MKGLDDGPDGLNDKSFDRALSAGPRRARKPKAAKRPLTEADLERAFAAACSHENRLIEKLPEKGHPTFDLQVAACWRAADSTNAAMKALQAFRDRLIVEVRS